MKIQSLGTAKSINAYVSAKLKRFSGMERNFASLFELMFSERGNTLYEKSDGYRIKKTTYGEAYEETVRKAATLRRLLSDLPHDAIVGIYMDNSLDWIETFWAVLKCGFRPLLMNLRMDDETLSSALKSCNAQAVISGGKTFCVKTLDAAALIPAAQPDTGSRFGSELLVMSSGTSSHVKLCAYGAQEVWYQICDSYDIIRRCRRIKKHYEGELKLLTFLPFYHIFGLVAVYIWFAFFSRTFVQLNDFAPQTIINTIRRHNVTHIFAVPLFWNKVYEQALRTIHERGEKTYAKFEKGLRLTKLPLIGGLVSKLAFREVRQNLFGESICFLITGGSEIRKPVMEFFFSVGYPLADGYGMSEIGITSVELSRRRYWLTNCYVGKPMTSFSYRINDDGVLLVKGKAAAKYIIENGNRHEGGDWFNTRDLASCKRGHYCILGRQDDLVISPAGENLNPNLIEPLLDGLGRGVCLIAERQESGSSPTLLVSVKPGISVQALTTLQQQVRQRLSELQLTAQIAKTVYLTDSLLEADDFKLNRNRLGRRYAAGSLHIVTPESLASITPPEDTLLSQLRLILATALNKAPEDVGYTTDFFTDEGGTSLDYFSMVSCLQEQYAIGFPTDAGKSVCTLQALYQYVEAALNDGC